MRFPYMRAITHTIPLCKINENAINKMRSNIFELLSFGDIMGMNSSTRVVCAMHNKNLM